jgi:hypothetical protein
MYDTAKRGMVLAAATGGLLLAGAANAMAETPTGVAEAPGGGSNATWLGPADATPSAGPAGLLSNNSIGIPLTLPVNLCGNALAVLGTAMSSGDCYGTGSATASIAAPARSGGLLSSNSVLAPLDIPVNLCGNAVAIAGHADSTSGSTCTADSGSGSTASSSTAMGSGAAPASTSTSALPVGQILGGVLSSNTVAMPLAAPVNVCGNALAAVGHSDSAANCTTSGSAASTAIAPQTSTVLQTTMRSAPAITPAARAAVAHPTVVWPRPEPAAFAIPADGPAHVVKASDVSQDPPAMALAHTGTETLLPVGAAAASLTGGIGLRAVGQHRRRDRV